MKFVIEDIGSFKKITSIICSMCSKKISEPSEQCVLIEANKKSNEVRFTATDSGSHSMSLTIEADVRVEGRCQLLGSKLTSLSKKLGSKGVLTVEVLNNNLYYNLPNMGSISEVLFHNQTSIKKVPKDIEEDDLKLIIDNCESIGSLLRTISSYSLSNKNVILMTGNYDIRLYSQFSESGYVRCVIGEMCDLEIESHINPSILKMVSVVGESLDIECSKKDRFIKFKSENGELNIISDSVNTKTNVVLETLFNLPTVGEFEINISDLEDALNWQSYGAITGQGVELKVVSDDLIIKSGRTNHPAKIGIINQLNFNPMIVSLSTLINSIKCLNSCKVGSSIKMEQKVHKIGEINVSILCISSNDESIKVLIYEQVKVEG